MTKSPSPRTNELVGKKKSSSRCFQQQRCYSYFPTKPTLIVKSWAASASPETSSSLVHLRAEADGRRVPDLNVRPCSHYCFASSFVIDWKLSLISLDWTTEKHTRTASTTTGGHRSMCTCTCAVRRPENTHILAGSEQGHGNKRSRGLAAE